MDISIEVGFGSRSINGVEVLACNWHGDVATFKLDRREVRLIKGEKVLVENPDIEERRRKGRVFMTLLNVVRGVAFLRVSTERKVPLRKKVRSKARKHRNTMGTEAVIYNEAFE